MLELIQNCHKCNALVDVLQYLSDEQVKFVLASDSNILTRCQNCNAEIEFKR